MKEKKGWFPYFSWGRFAGVSVWVILAAYLLYRYWHSVWVLIIIITAFVLITAIAYFGGMMKARPVPAPAPKQYPFAPSTSTRELWKQEDARQTQYHLSGPVLTKK